MCRISQKLRRVSSKLQTVRNALSRLFPFALVLVVIPVVCGVAVLKIWQLLQEPGLQISMVEVLNQANEAACAGYYDNALAQYDSLHKDVSKISSKSKRAEFYCAVALGRARCYYILGLSTKSKDSIKKSTFFTEQVFNLIPLKKGQTYWAHAYYSLGLAYWALSEYDDPEGNLKKAIDYFKKCLDLTSERDTQLFKTAQSGLDSVTDNLEIVTHK